MKKALTRLFGRKKRVLGGGTQRPAADPALEAFLLRMPKVELLVQLESCLRPARLLSLIAKHRQDLPIENEADVRKLLLFRDTQQHDRLYRLFCRALGDVEDVHLLALDFLAEQAIQNVRYSEVSVEVGAHLERGLHPEGLRQALAAASADGQQRHGVAMRVLVSIDLRAGGEVARQAIEWALADRDELVVGIDLRGVGRPAGNKESAEVLEDVRPIGEQVAAAGLRRVFRSGAAEDPETLRALVAEGWAERLGEDLRVVADRAILEELAARGTPLLACPSAAVRRGFCADLDDHPFDSLRDRGMSLSVHSGGAPLYGTNLTREYVRLHQTFGDSADDLAALVLAALDASFLPAGAKEALASEFRRDFADLGGRWLERAVEVG